ncbi:MAG: carbamoyltransferase HypF [Bryobacteraceae bacterium]
MTAARSIRVRGVVQGVGFRPFVFRLAHANSLAGWVLNEAEGVDIHIEGSEPAVQSFLSELASRPPAAAQIAAIDVQSSDAVGMSDFTIRGSRLNGNLSVRISPDLPVCKACLTELFDPADQRCGYPYINCTNCGPRYSVIEGLPYDRPKTTMKPWSMDHVCAAQYGDPTDRRFHAQPIACPACGPHFNLESSGEDVSGDLASIEATVRFLNAGQVVAVKGIGGYHLACDARNSAAVRALRERKFRKEMPFAVMVRDLEVARTVVELSRDAEALLTSVARPILLARTRVQLPEVAPDNDELGVMLPYAPLHHLLFAAGAPDALVMTSANRSSEPIAYLDADLRENLAGMADAFLIGERPIARRIDDSVVRAGPFGPVILRRSRGYAPGAVATIASRGPILAVGADLKNAITLVVNGQAFVSQHIGDLDQYSSFQAFQQTIRDLTSMYEVDYDELLVVHDKHPQYASTLHALDLQARRKTPVQHHRAHVASVVAERQAWDIGVVGVSFDGTGYGDDGTIWGGEFFVGSLLTGFIRVMHLRRAYLPGGDAAARYPVQCAAGFLSQLEHCPEFGAAPFHFPRRYRACLELLNKKIRTFETTSVGRLFDTAAALLGFTREISFEGQAAMWLEHVAKSASDCEPYPFPLDGDVLDFRPLLESIICDRLLGRQQPEIARAFHLGLASGLCKAALRLCEAHSLDTVVLSGGVFQNELLLEAVKLLLDRESIHIWTNSAVPPNDGGISLGQAALAALGSSRDFYA